MAYLNQNPQKQHFSVATQPFTASDGYALIGTLYTPEHDIKANIVLCSATGVPQAFYRRFAEYATQFGYQVLTFDYRGIAQSAPKQLKGFKMSYLDWGTLDLAAAINFLAQDPIRSLWSGILMVDKHWV